MNQTMRAVRLHALGDPESLAVERLPRPDIGPEDVLVQVIAAALTRDELDWPEGRLPAIPSYEFSGIVDAVGTEVESLTAGEEVYALVPFDRDGAAAEYIALPQSVLAPKPRALSHIESAALPLAALSAWQGLFDRGKLAPGERVLIHGVGGVGSFAVQLARARDAHTMVTTSPQRAQAARELGADEVVDPSSDAIEPVDLVFDTAGGARLAGAAAAVRNGGRVVSVVTEPPPYPDRPDVEATFFIVEPNSEELREIASLADQAKLRPVIDEVFALAEVGRAFERVASQAHHGKVVLRISDEG
jgi:NADPH:quinone reductase-like Zn-dependent oxidoreductase